jgi:hypothetical protein
VRMRSSLEGCPGARRMGLHRGAGRLQRAGAQQARSRGQLGALLVSRRQPVGVAQPAAGVELYHKICLWGSDRRVTPHIISTGCRLGTSVSHRDQRGVRGRGSCRQRPQSRWTVPVQLVSSADRSACVVGKLPHCGAVGSVRRRISWEDTGSVQAGSPPSVPTSGCGPGMLDPQHSNGVF